MDAREEHIRSLIERPRESAAVELKAWFDPSDPDGVARIVRTTFALWNHNGGFFVIGVDDATRSHLPAPSGFVVREKFHTDYIQHLVSKYASQPFEIAVDFPKVGEQEHPVISVPGGTSRFLPMRVTVSFSA